MMIYFDNNATTRLDPRVAEAMRPYLEGAYANPSSLHRFGRAARDAVEAARAQVAALVGVQPQQVIFTSGGTEADNLAVKGVCTGNGGRILYAATEHPAVMESCEALRARGSTVEVLPVDSDGVLDWTGFEERLARGPVRLVAVMAANNETGVIQDVARAARLVHAAGSWLLVDAVQAAGKLAVDFDALGADLMSLSAHKLHGPRGVGALVRRGEVELAPLHHGGGQEHGLRGGTENVAAIVGFGVAADLARQELEARAAHGESLRRRLEAGLRRLPGAVIFAQAAPRLPNTVQFALPGWHGEALLMALDKRGIAVSSGSACHSGRGEPSHVLLAMGVAREIAHGAVRVSFSKDNTADEVDALLAALTELQRQAAAA